MRDARAVDRLSYVLILCCGIGHAGCSDDVGEAMDEDSSTGDPTDASATMTMDPSADGPDSSSTDPDPTADSSTSEGESESEGDSDSDSDSDSEGDSSSDASDSSTDTGDDTSTGEPAECELDGDCDDAAACTEDHCVDGTCTFSPIDGVSAPQSAQTAGDCQVVFCVAGVPTDQADDADLPDDGDACTDDLCVEGAPSHPPADLPMCVPEPICDNGLDDDLDGLPDCTDGDCNGIAGCELGAETSCADGFDNDADASVDCEDADCNGVGGCELGTELTCNDGFDNDADASVDCTDADCNGIAGCELGTEVTCDDTLDNDGDGAADCSDTDCAFGPPCVFEVCTNGFDDDADGFTDCNDPDCTADASCLPEADCNDGIDNDGDGETDCQEALCDGIDGCTYDGEHDCNDGFDNDGDGLVDAAEAVCSWVNAAIPGCAAGHAFGFVAADLPQTIPSVGSSTRNSYIPVALGSTVAAVAVRINISHTYDSDLDILLFSPSGTSRELSTDNGGAGGSGDNFTNTVFTDAGPGVIGSAGFNDPPYAGTYRPEQAFAPTLVGQTTDGNWNLRVSDQFNLDGGTMNAFHLALCTQ